MMTPLSRPGLVLLIMAFCFLATGLTTLALAKVPALILKDMERETSVELYKTGDPDGGKFYLYINKRYGYSAWIPSGITQVVILPNNGDGLILASKDDLKRFRASGGLAEFLFDGFKGSFDQAFKAHEPNLIRAVFNQNTERSEWIVSWKENNTIHHRKFVVKDDHWFDCELSYPASNEGEWGRIADDVLRNFGPAEG